jgi:hypothetical protein
MGCVHVPDRFDLRYPELYGGLSQIVDAYNKRRAAVG